jgi:hypothetical protein
MTLAILCSGQGGQHADMFALTGSSQAAEGLFSHAATLLREDPRTWVTSAGEKALHANRSAQLLCTRAGYRDGVWAPHANATGARETSPFGSIEVVLMIVHLTEARFAPYIRVVIGITSTC